jgi:hypothetical protein
MSSHFLRMVAASERLTPGWEHVRYNASLGYSLQFTVGLAPVTPEDDDETARRKIELVARYLNMFIARRIVNFRNYGYSPTLYTMHVLSKRLRGAPLDELVDLLRDEAEDLAEEGWESRGLFGLHGRNRPQVRYLLARLTDHVEREVGNEPGFDTYISRDRKDKFEIEHIWADKYERHREEFDHEHDFADVRNRVGDLLLLPKSFNASYGALPYEEKLEHYRGQNPNLRRFIERSGLPLRPHTEFDSAAIEQRQDLYLQMAAQIWDTDRLLVIDD